MDSKIHFLSKSFEEINQSTYIEEDSLLMIYFYIPNSKEHELILQSCFNYRPSVDFINTNFLSINIDTSITTNRKIWKQLKRRPYLEELSNSFKFVNLNSGLNVGLYGNFSFENGLNKFKSVYSLLK